MLIREATISLAMVMQGDHEERISLFLIDSPVFPVVLGLPWLALHNPTISWQQRALWLRECSGTCVGISVGATMVESPDQEKRRGLNSVKRRRLNYHLIDGGIVR